MNSTEAKKKAKQYPEQLHRRQSVEHENTLLVNRTLLVAATPTKRIRDAAIKACI